MKKSILVVIVSAVATVATAGTAALAVALDDGPLKTAFLAFGLVGAVAGMIGILAGLYLVKDAREHPLVRDPKQDSERL